MGNEKSSTTTTSQATATPEERQLEALQLQRVQSSMPQQMALDQSMYGAMNTVLQGGQLPGNLQGITGITQDQTNNMVQQSLRGIYPQFQSSGLMDSGTAVQAATRTAADTANANAQFNVSAISQLFNQALGGSSSLSSGMTQQGGVLGQQLAGLRSQTGTSTTSSMNPFLKSFQTTMGNTLAGGQSASGTSGGSMAFFGL